MYVKEHFVRESLSLIIRDCSMLHAIFSLVSSRAVINLRAPFLLPKASFAILLFLFLEITSESGVCLLARFFSHLFFPEIALPLVPSLKILIFSPPFPSNSDARIILFVTYTSPEVAQDTR